MIIKKKVGMQLNIFSQPPLFFLKKLGGSPRGCVWSNDFSSGVGPPSVVTLQLFFVGFEEIAIAALVPRVSLRNLVSVDRTSTPEDTEGASRSGVQK